MDKSTVTTPEKAKQLRIIRKRQFCEFMDDFINQIAEDPYRESLGGALHRMERTDD